MPRKQCVPYLGQYLLLKIAQGRNRMAYYFSQNKLIKASLNSIVSTSLKEQTAVAICYLSLLPLLLGRLGTIQPTLRRKSSFPPSTDLGLTTPSVMFSLGCAPIQLCTKPSQRISKLHLGVDVKFGTTPIAKHEQGRTANPSNPLPHPRYAGRRI